MHRFQVFISFYFCFAMCHTEFSVKVGLLLWFYLVFCFFFFCSCLCGNSIRFSCEINIHVVYRLALVIYVNVFIIYSLYLLSSDIQLCVFFLCLCLCVCVCFVYSANIYYNNIQYARKVVNLLFSFSLFSFFRYNFAFTSM